VDETVGEENEPLKTKLGFLEVHVRMETICLYSQTAVTKLLNRQEKNNGFNAGNWKYCGKQKK